MRAMCVAVSCGDDSKENRLLSHSRMRIEDG
jgi:hypothetical protein